MITEQEVIGRLRALADQQPSRATAGAVWSVSGSFLCDVLAGRKAPTDLMLRSIGLRKRKVWVFEQRETT